MLSHSVVSDSLHLFGLWPIGLLCLLDFSGKNTAVDCHALLQGIFLTEGSNPHLLHLLHWQACSLPPAPPTKKLSSFSWRMVLEINIWVLGMPVATGVWTWLEKL